MSSAGASSSDQPELLPGLVRETVARSRKAAATRARKAAAAPLAEVDPVARVLVDLPLAHLDRPFDYSVPETMAAAARPGVRVKVRFAGQDVDGFVVERRATSDHAPPASFRCCRCFCHAARRFRCRRPIRAARGGA